jgi:hypothetical protein
MTSARRRTDGPSGGFNTTWIIVGAVALGVIGLGYLLYLNVRPEPAIEGVVVFPRPSRGHDNTVAYDYGGLPPIGGIHNDTWENCGIYDEPVEGKHAVHSMEHGAVWITYRPDLPADQIETLKEQARGENFVLLSPWPDQTSPVALTAWGVQLTVDSASDDRIARFIKKYEVGPQTPERGATCQRGTGIPSE